MADPDFALRRGKGSILLAQPAYFFVFTQNKGEGGKGEGAALDPPLDKSINQLYLKHGKWLSKLVFRHAV